MQLLDSILIKKKKKFSVLKNNSNLFSLSRELGEIIFKIKKDFEKFKFNEIPSVELDKMKIDTNSEVSKRVKKLSKISLLEHIENVEKVIDETIDFKNNDPMSYATLKLLALLHDAGKSKILRATYNISDNIKHEEASYIYAKEILKNTSFEFIADFLKDTSTHFFKELAKIDKIARKKELESIEKRN